MDDFALVGKQPNHVSSGEESEYDEFDTDSDSGSD